MNRTVIAIAEAKEALVVDGRNMLLYAHWTSWEREREMSNRYLIPLIGIGDTDNTDTDTAVLFTHTVLCFKHRSTQRTALDQSLGRRDCLYAHADHSYDCWVRADDGTSQTHPMAPT